MSRPRQILHRRIAPALVAAGVILTASPAAADPGTQFREPERGQRGAIATESPAATAIGLAVLDAGGNAIDAAIATVFAINVARPQSCGIGGGGFMVYRSGDGEIATLDFREEAPAAFTPTTLQTNGINQGFTGHLVVGVPGTVAGLAAMLERYGSFDWADLIEPAAALAEAGFPVPDSMSQQLVAAAPRLRLFAPAAETYLMGGVAPYPPGTTFTNPDLAATLRTLAANGPDDFYTGEVGAQLIAEMVNNGGAYPGDDALMTAEDLASYEAVWREPLAGTYRGHEIIAMPPPTSGGVAMLEILNLLEGFDFADGGHGNADHLHLVAEAQKLAWADRGAYLGDPDHVDVPTQTLISKAYADTRRPEIDPGSAGSYEPGDVGVPAKARGADFNPLGSTTHLSVIDEAGNAVALTCTIEQSFGSAVVVEGAGYLLNNELTDFSGAGTANEPGPGKRPRSSISPTIVVRDGIPVLAVGGAGGATIIMGSVHAVINTIDFGMGPSEAIDAARLDSTSSPVMALENVRIAPDVQAELLNRGHFLQAQGEYWILPRVQAVAIDPATGEVLAASDSRTDWAAAAQTGEPSEPPAPQPEVVDGGDQPSTTPTTGGGLAGAGLLALGLARRLTGRANGVRVSAGGRRTG